MNKRAQLTQEEIDRVIESAYGIAGPQRYQLSRRKGKTLPPGTVYVGRPSRWGNPHRIGFCPLCGYTHSRKEAVNLFASEIMVRLEDNPNALSELRGKSLACWCDPDDECHADVLLSLANLPTT